MVDFTAIGIEIVKLIPTLYKKIKNWIEFTKPALKVLNGIQNQQTELNIFVKDLICPNNTYQFPKLISFEGKSIQSNPNIEKVWPEVEAKAICKLLNLLGSLGKKEKFEIIEMSKGFDIWDKNMIILGAQATKCREFYEIMKDVGYRVDEHSIYDMQSNNPIEMDSNFGYGIILKCSNPNLKNKNNTSFLLGGYGVLGTSSAVYYFINNIHKLGKEFNRKNFSIIVKARKNAGEQSVSRIKKYDKEFN